MRYLKLLSKIIVGIIGISILSIFVLLSGESYQIVHEKQMDVEIKKFFGTKLSECSINSSGFYDGSATSWHLFSKTIRNEGEYKQGYWHGQWSDFDRNGNLTMVREWDMGKLNKLFIPEGSELKEIQQEQWPNYADIKQPEPQRINE